MKLDNFLSVVSLKTRRQLRTSIILKKNKEIFKFYYKLQIQLRSIGLLFIFNTVVRSYASSHHYDSAKRRLKIYDNP